MKVLVLPSRGSASILGDPREMSHVCGNLWRDPFPQPSGPHFGVAWQTGARRRPRGLHVSSRIGLGKCTSNEWRRCGGTVPGQIAIVGCSVASRPAAGTLNRNSGRNGTGGTGTLAGGTAQGKCIPPFANGRGLCSGGSVGWPPPAWPHGLCVCCSASGAWQLRYHEHRTEAASELSRLNVAALVPPGGSDA